jgi:hypothetical protein
MEKLPKKWRLPPLVSGRVGGSVVLDVTTEEGHTQVKADGLGEIRNPRIAGVPARAIRLRVTNDGSGFRFQPVPMTMPPN